MEIRVFNNWNASLREKYLSFWGQKLDSTFYAPVDKATLSGAATTDDAATNDALAVANEPDSYWSWFKTEILDSVFVDSSASFWAIDGSPEDPKPVACLVAASAPNDDALDGADATLCAPLFAAGVADDDKVSAAQMLIEASENALRTKGFRRVYAGGAPPRTDVEGYAPVGAPLLNGVYGAGSPVGFFDDDPARKFFIDAGYAPEPGVGGARAFVERKIDANSFFGNADELPTGCRLAREPWQAQTWRRSAIERNFLNARRFCVRWLDSSLLAVAWVYDVIRREPKTGELVVKTVVSRLSTRPAYRGRGLGTALVAALVEDASTQALKMSPNASLEICVVVPDGDAVAGGFWDAQGFEVGRRSTPLVKTL